MKSKKKKRLIDRLDKTSINKTDKVVKKLRDNINCVEIKD